MRRSYGASEARHEVPIHPLFLSLRHLSPLGHLSWNGARRRQHMNAEWLVELHGAHNYARRQRRMNAERGVDVRGVLNWRGGGGGRRTCLLEVGRPLCCRGQRTGRCAEVVGRRSTNDTCV